MGGGDHHAGADAGDFRAKVWSMTGGPYCRPKHWKRNTAIAMFGVFLVCIPIAMKSAELEQRPHHPVRPIPSQLWCKNFGNKEYQVLCFALQKSFFHVIPQRWGFCTYVWNKG